MTVQTKERKTVELKFSHFRDKVFYFDGQWITNGDYMIKSRFCRLAPEIKNKGLDFGAPRVVKKCFTKNAEPKYNPKPLDYLIHPQLKYVVEKVEDYEASELLRFKRLYFTEDNGTETRATVNTSYFNMLNKIFPIFSDGIEWRINSILSAIHIYKNEEVVALVMPEQMR